MDFSKIKPSKSMAIYNKVHDLKSRGIDVISFGVGDTHFSPPPTVLNNINDSPKDFSHYTRSKGIDSLREELAKKYNTNTVNISITSGVKQGLLYSLLSLEGSEVCVLEPSWLGYKATISICNKNTTTVNLYEIDWIDKLTKSNFQILILCSPNNPNGKVFSQQEINEITSICTKKNAWIIFDNIYSLYDYSGKYKIFEYNKLIIAGGFSKSHAVTGFRIGYIVCEDKKTHTRIDLLNQNIATCAPSISQYALRNLANHQEAIYRYASYYKKNRNLISEKIPEFESFKPDGAFYYFVDISKFGFKSGEVFCNNILNEQKVALVPGNAYGNFPTFVRLSFSVDREILSEGLDRLKKFLRI